MLVMAPDGGALIPRMFCGGRAMNDAPETTFTASVVETMVREAIEREREACARIADIHRAWWEEGEDSGAAAAANIARAIRKRTPERGGDVVDDSGAGAAVRASPTKHSSHHGGGNDA